MFERLAFEGGISVLWSHSIHLLQQLLCFTFFMAYIMLMIAAAIPVMTKLMDSAECAGGDWVWL